LNFRICSITVCLLLAAGSSSAGISIGSGGYISLGQGALDLGGGNLTINGQFDAGSGTVSEIGDLVFNGALEGGSGSLFLRGDWVNNGSFDAGTGQVSMVDDVGASSLIMGTSTFHSLSLTSSAGGSFVLESGLTQRVTDVLTIQGISGQPLQIRSSSPPQIAELLLEPTGTQNIAFVGVSDVHATGQPLAPEQSNQGGTGNAFGWFGIGGPLAIPTLSIGGLTLLILALFVVTVFRRGGVA